ncbi:MAG: type I restriction enzyme HsdR N-terminal domain-containing protein [Bacteroidetes bacterium]|nr:type I restriction enzyme HsdR N-terminal domain-containing protein [Bacteroidota bacterium]MBU1373316.1 type I restriction enzyme HsdR N-terminal domain-containing protein [Bacteroidota bacterium]MBU1484407.1 type I restriction enzyme HsdR N-terminal domain-containing protein [Bacteroidota bacterium]MBU1762110.1 type I restriction enzyme HsdR N-terminal domain-containing protein [Bacteroidota bacterium]MBU2045973.1 type I restriction enzyme HsdR N-terminal domain-containing protein [Bactero
MFKPKLLNLPPYPFKLTQKDDTLFIFDELRKKSLVLTPEEWVRQHFIQFLIHQKKYPRTLIKLEGGLKLNQLQKRTDILVFNSLGKADILVECKASSVKIDQKVFDQIARYNMVHQVNYLAVSNGLQHYFCRMDYQNSTYAFIEDLPLYSEI